MSDFESVETLDIPRARKVLEHLRAHPGEHDQSYFGRKTLCGTTMCIAGTTVVMFEATKLCWTDDGFMMPLIGGEKWMDERAAELLGITSALDRERLFYDFNNARALDKLENWIAQAEAVQR